MDEEEEQRHYGCGDRGSRFGARRLKPRSNGNHQLLLMDCVGDAEGASKETVPLPEYERLSSQSARLPDDPDPKNMPPPRQRLAFKQSTSPPRQQQKPAAWRLMEYVVRSRHKSSSGAAGGGCGSSNGESKSSGGEKEAGDGGEDGKKDKNKKKRSSWLPDPDRRWPVQGFY